MICWLYSYCNQLVTAALKFPVISFFYSRSKQTPAEGGASERNSIYGNMEDDSACTGNDFVTVRTATVIEKVPRMFTRQHVSFFLFQFKLVKVCEGHRDTEERPDVDLRRKHH